MPLKKRKVVAIKNNNKVLLKLPNLKIKIIDSAQFLEQYPNFTSLKASYMDWRGYCYWEKGN